MPTSGIKNPNTKSFTDSWDDCVAFAKLFHNTCEDDADPKSPTIVDNVALLASNNQVECEYTGPNCVDSGTRTTDSEDCTFTRKLCVKCYCSDPSAAVGDAPDGSLDASGGTKQVCVSPGNTRSDIRIDVKANGLPLNCFYGFSEVVEQNIGFNVIWNPTSSVNKVNFSQEFTSDSYGDLLCDREYVSNSRGGGFNYISGSNDMEHAVGISMDGVLIFPNLEEISSGVFVDQWTPSTNEANLSLLNSYAARQVDACLGSISDAGEYHYMSASECITARIQDNDGAYLAPAFVVSVGRICPSCEENMGYQIGKVGGDPLRSDVEVDVAPGSIIGLAKDGHVIYGPVKSGTNAESNVVLYDACEIDACNGIQVELDDGQEYYRYVATTSHPYLVGCFGPTDSPTGSVNG